MGVWSLCRVEQWGELRVICCGSGFTSIIYHEFAVTFSQAVDMKASIA